MRRLLRRGRTPLSRCWFERALKEGRAGVARAEGACMSGEEEGEGQLYRRQQ